MAHTFSGKRQTREHSDSDKPRAENKIRWCKTLTGYFHLDHQGKLLWERTFKLRCKWQEDTQWWRGRTFQPEEPVKSPAWSPEVRQHWQCLKKNKKLSLVGKRGQTQGTKRRLGRWGGAKSHGLCSRGSVWFYLSTVEIYHSTVERCHFSQKSQGSRTGFTPQNFKVSIHSLFLVPDNSSFWWTYNAFHKQVRGVWKAWNTGYLGSRRKEIFI